MGDQESLQEWNKKRGPDPMRSGERRIFQTKEATMIGSWGGDLLFEKQLGVGSVDPHAEPEGHQDGVNLFKQLLPWVWGCDTTPSSEVTAFVSYRQSGP